MELSTNQKQEKKSILYIINNQYINYQTYCHLIIFFEKNHFFLVELFFLCNFALSKREIYEIKTHKKIKEL